MDANICGAGQVTARHERSSLHRSRPRSFPLSKNGLRLAELSRVEDKVILLSPSPLAATAAGAAAIGAAAVAEGSVDGTDVAATTMALATAAIGKSKDSPCQRALGDVIKESVKNAQKVRDSLDAVDKLPVMMTAEDAL